MDKLILKQKQERGQGLVEYAIIISLVAVVVIGVMQVLGPKIGNTFSEIYGSLGLGGPQDFGSHAINYGPDKNEVVHWYCESYASSGSGYNMYFLDDVDSNNSYYLASGSAFTDPGFTFQATGTCP